MGAVEQPDLFIVEAELSAASVEVGDAGIERRVQIERAGVAGEQRRDIALDGFDRVAGVGAGETPPVMMAPPGATQDVTQAARDVMRKVDEFITQNQESFKAAVANVEKFTAALSNNTDKIDRTLGNIEKFTAALGGNTENIDRTLANIERFTGALGRNSDRIDHIAQGLESLTGGADGQGGDINAAARSIKALADNLDKRTEALTADIARLARTGSRTLTTIDRAAKNFDENPSRIIWGGSPPDQKKREQQRTPAVR